MATNVGVAFIDIVPNMATFGAQLQAKSAAPAMAAGTKAGKGFSAGLLGAMKSAAAPLAAVFAVSKGIDFLGSTLDEAREAQKVMAQTTQTIKTTGGAAKVSAGDVEKLSGALSAQTGIDDELIQSGANFLLTFKNIRNEAGKNNDIFNQSVKAATDLSVAWKTDVKSASVQLGKALNDPIKGMTALGKSGITFTKQQKDQIKTLTETGKTLEAQKIILGEVNSQIGGQATKQASAADKAKVAWGNFKETIGTALLPVVDKLLNAFTALVPQLTEVGGKIGGFVGTLAPMFTQMWSVVGPILTQIGTALSTAFAQALPIIKATFTTIGQIVTGAIQILKAAWQQFGPTILANLQIVFTTIVNVVRSAMTILKGIIDVVLGLIKGDWSRVWQGIKGILSGVWSGIKAIVSGAVGYLKNILSAAWNFIKAITSRVWNGIKSALSRAWDGIKSVVRSGVNTIKGFIENLSSIPGRVGKFFADAYNAAVKALGKLIEWVKGLPGKVISAIGNIGKAMWKIGSNIIGGIVQGLKNSAHRIVQAIKNFVIDKIPGPIKDFFGINSPSTYMMAMGEDISAGMGIGIEKGARKYIDPSSLIARVPQLSGTAAGPALAGGALYLVVEDGTVLRAWTRARIDDAFTDVTRRVRAGTRT